MKKFLATAAAVLLTAFGAAAGDWEIFSLSFTEDVPSDAATTEVRGTKVGIPITAGPAPVCGLDFAICWAATEKVDGVQCSTIGNGGKKVNGLQFAIVNFAEEVCGLQLGVFNSAKGKSFQIGILNHIEGGLIPWFPVINMKF